MIRAFLLLFIFTLLVACQQNDFKTIQGPTMGTQYQVKFAPGSANTAPLKQDIEQLLNKVNQQMSTYISDSEISQFNLTESTECLSVSPWLLDVIEEAKRIYSLSQGAFDPTLGPLIELWGFDKKETDNKVPDAATIQNGLKQLDFGQMSVNRSKSCVTKSRAATTINLSAIAKGYAVDKIAELLEDSYQVKHYLVDIGGEVRLNGLSPRQSEWNIAIESPSAKQRGIQRIINPGNNGVATSGDYRNYFEKNGKRYSHTINPQTGYPIVHNLASVTVIHRSTMTADALATAFLVLGKDQAMYLAEKEGIPVFMLVKTSDGFKEVFNTTFEPFLKTKAQP